MNENIDLTKILDGCPIGVRIGKLTIIQEVERVRHPNGKTSRRGDFEITDQRDWAKFKRFWDKPKVKRFDPKTLQPYDKVIVRAYNSSIWSRTFFGYMGDTCAMCLSAQLFFEPWKQCIPYNEETKYLVGTTDDCPEFYKWWEE